MPVNAACTLAPGPDPRNPDSPCGTGPEDISTAVDAYKSIQRRQPRQTRPLTAPDKRAADVPSGNLQWCPGWDSNPHAPWGQRSLRPRKSPASDLFM